MGRTEQANEYLQQEYLPEHNGRFRRAAAEVEDYHRRAPSEAELREVFRLETERVIGNDWVVRYDNRLFQVQAQSRKYAPAQGKVVVCEWQDGSIEIEYRGRKLPWKEILGTEPRVSGGAEAVAAVSGCGLRCTLNAPHNPRRRVPLRPQPETEQIGKETTECQNAKRGHF